MTERLPLLTRLAISVLKKYDHAVGGGNTSVYVKDGLQENGMAEGLMRFAEVCDASAKLVAAKMGLAGNQPAEDLLSFLHFVAAPPLLILSLLGEYGLQAANKLSEIQIRLPQAPTAAPAVDWDWNPGTQTIDIGGGNIAERYKNGTAVIKFAPDETGRAAVRGLSQEETDRLFPN